MPIINWGFNVAKETMVQKIIMTSTILVRLIPALTNDKSSAVHVACNSVLNLHRPILQNLPLVCGDDF